MGANMRRILIIALVLLGGIFVSVMASLTKTVTRTETDATKTQIHSRMANYDLHVAQPNKMKTLPVELVPLP
jgi:hypothetical protein